MYSCLPVHANLLNPCITQTSPCTIYIYPISPPVLARQTFRLPSFLSHLHWKVSKGSLCLNRLFIRIWLSHFLHSHRDFLCAHLIQQDALRVLTYFKSFPLSIEKKYNPLSLVFEALQGLTVLWIFFPLTPDYIDLLFSETFWHLYPYHFFLNWIMYLLALSHKDFMCVSCLCYQQPNTEPLYCISFVASGSTPRIS